MDTVTARCPRLIEAIDAYRSAFADLDAAALDVLERLAADTRATAPFERLNLNRVASINMLATCVQAEQIARTLSDRIAKADDFLSRAASLNDAVAMLREYINQTVEPPAPSDHLSARVSAAHISDDQTDIGVMKRGLYLIRCRIDLDHQLANETLAGSASSARRIGRRCKTPRSNGLPMACSGLPDGPIGQPSPPWRAPPLISTP